MRNRLFVVMLGICAANAGGAAFQNLNFESASLTPIPEGQPGVLVPINLALPSWSGFLGTQQVTFALQNDLYLGSASVGILGPNGATHNIIAGQYTAVLQAGSEDGAFVDASIVQSGVIPIGTESIRLNAYNTNFSVSFDAQELSPVPLSTGSNYTLYGADVAQFAGHSGNLTISALSLPTSHFNTIFIDSIVFSTQIVPEPGVLALLAVGLSLLGWRCLRKRGGGEASLRVPEGQPVAQLTNSRAGSRGMRPAR